MSLVGLNTASACGRTPSIAANARLENSRTQFAAVLKNIGPATYPTFEEIRDWWRPPQASFQQLMLCGFGLLAWRASDSADKCQRHEPHRRWRDRGSP